MPILPIRTARCAAIILLTGMEVQLTGLVVLDEAWTETVHDCGSA